MTQKRKVIDCRWDPSEGSCTLAVSGSEEEVMQASIDHAVQAHGEEDTPELRHDIRKYLRDEKRKVIDCRWFPSENQCSLAISGSEEEVLNAAVAHAVKTHGEKDTPEFRKEIRRLLKEAED